MRRATTILALAMGTLILADGPAARACGDKLLSIARGIRLKQAYTARHPASILLYVGDLDKAKLSRSERNRLVQLSILYMSLRQAGHELGVAQNPDELERAAAERTFDFVMADVSDVEAVAKKISGSSGAAIVPVLFKPKEDEMAAANALFGLALKIPATSVDHLEAIDEAMASRSRVAASVG